VEQYVKDTDHDLFVVANPDVQWGPGSIDILVDAAARWPQAGALGPLIRDPDGAVYPSARHQPSLIRGGMHAVVGQVWRNNPWTAAYRQTRVEPSERPVGWLSGSCLLLRRAAFDEVGGFDERYFMYMEDVDLGDRLGRAGWQNVYVPSAEILHDKGHATGRDPARNLAAHHVSTYTFLADRYSHWSQAPLRWTIKSALAARAGLVVRNSRRRQAKGRRR
jgi:N-acetylglucosaminyl-diphospho-decaprenol L-rhamnosyltransferase